MRADDPPQQAVAVGYLVALDVSVIDVCSLLQGFELKSAEELGR